jgi:hypothetical protein
MTADQAGNTVVPTTELISLAYTPTLSIERHGAICTDVEICFEPPGPGVELHKTIRGVPDNPAELTFLWAERHGYPSIVRASHGGPHGFATKYDYYQPDRPDWNTAIQRQAYLADILLRSRGFCQPEVDDTWLPYASSIYSAIEVLVIYACTMGPSVAAAVMADHD